VNVLFAEKFFAGKLADTIQSETGVQVFSFSHISDGDFTPVRYEEEMRYNLDSLQAAIESTVP
jgi:zinc transport system substrate-binding protein